jgi:LacI family transcriptional regulator
MSELKDSAQNAPSRITLKDVARETGYHVTTISNALRDHPSIPEDTRHLIQAAAKRLGYEKNPVFFALSRFRKEGHVCGPRPRIAYLENFGLGSGRSRPPHQELILAGAKRQASLLGYELDALAVGEDDYDARSLGRYLKKHDISGLIIGAFQPGFSEIALNWEDYALAKIHSRHTAPKTTVVGNDQLREVRLAFKKLAELGYKRIGLVVGRAEEDACAHRHSAGYLMEENGVPEEQRIAPLLVPYNLDEASIGAMVGRWVQRQRVDALISTWNNMGTLLAAEKIKVPSEIALASLCLSEHSSPELAGIRPRYDLVGERAVSIVVTQLKAGDRGLTEFPSSIYVQSSWQDGKSAPKKNK